MTNVITGFHDRARQGTARILLPEGEDIRILQAAEDLASEGLAAPIVIEGNETRQLCTEHDIETAEITFRSRPTENDEEYVRAYADLRDVTLSVAREMLCDELVFGALLLRLDEGDGLVAGVNAPTADVVAAANGVVGLADGIETASSYFLMGFDDPSIGENGALLYADCGVNIAPTSGQLADIAVATADTARTLLQWSPRVAMLSFSTKGSAAHEEVDRVRQATELAADRLPDGVIDGELQADVALVPSVADQKLPDDGSINGDANVLIFPDLDAGNIAYKLTQRLAGARALGPVLQGYSRPVSDLSRGADTSDIIDIAALTAVRSAEEQLSDGAVIHGGLLARREAAATSSEESL